MQDVFHILERISNFVSSTQFDPHDPLFIHHAIHPNQSLMSTPLSSDNFESWRYIVAIILESIKKIDFVDESLPKLPDPTKLPLWKRNDSIVKSWLLNSFTKETATSIIYSFIGNIMDLRLDFPIEESYFFLSPNIYLCWKC